VIVLTEIEMEIAAMVGCRRRSESRSNSREYAHGFDGSGGWDIDIEGAAAELAYAKYRGQYWPATVCSFKHADVGANVQIRSTPHANGSLIIRDDDNAEHFYVLLTGTAPTFQVRGYIQGISAQNDEWRQAPNGRPAAYFVPQSALKPFEKKDNQ